MSLAKAVSRSWATGARRLMAAFSIALLAHSSAPFAQMITTYAGAGTADGVPATSTRINRPSGIVADAAGNFYFSESWNHRVRMVNASTGIISTVAGTGIVAFGADGVAANTATGKAPTSNLESAILITLDPGAYTVVVSGVNNGVGVGVVEVFAQ